MTKFDFITGWSWMQDGQTYQSYLKEKGLHHCEESFPYASYGTAVDECVELPTGILVVCNGEYSTQVNYCPFCGYKAKIQVK